MIPISLQEPSTNRSSESTGLRGTAAVQRPANTEQVRGQGEVTVWQSQAGPDGKRPYCQAKELRIGDVKG